jgi:pSer/pThr/pTyr-binding forkhead associated (FHA) protein
MSGIIFLILRFAFTISLYIFVGWALYVMWKELKQQSNLLATRQPTALTLSQQMDDDTNKTRFTIPEITIGRDPACNFPLNDSTVSAQHARLSFRQGQWWVEDLRSTNGTFLNQVPVSLPLVVTTGDELRFGQVKFMISIGEG